MSSRDGDRISRELRSRGLAVPALILLDAHRPLRPLLGLAATAALPLVRPLLGPRVEDWRRMLDDDEDYDALVERLRDEVDA